MYAAYLAYAGFEAFKASDGFEALRLAVQARPNVILMDVNLPGLDGFEVTRRLKQDRRTSSIPVVALTAHAAPTQRDMFKARGFAALLLKPCLPDLLAQEVRRLIGTPEEDTASLLGATA